jgi:hypothetical protein
MEFQLVIGLIALFGATPDYTLCYRLVSLVTVFTSLLVTASKGGLSLSSGFRSSPPATATETLDELTQAGSHLTPISFSSHCHLSQHSPELQTQLTTTKSTAAPPPTTH